MKQVYYETVRDGLIPVRLAHKIDNLNASAIISKSMLGYKKGETITACHFHFVNKVRYSGYHLMVKNAL